MKLYYIPGACSLASHIILNEVGADFEIEKVDVKEKRTESGVDYHSINPLGYVPALSLSDGTYLLEGPAVLQHVADQFPGANLSAPSGSVERARMVSMLNFTSSELQKAFSPFFADVPLEGASREAAISKIHRLVGYLEDHFFNQSPYLLGDRFTIADAYAFVVLSWADFMKISLEDFPKVEAFIGTVAARPASIKAMQAEGLLN